MYTFGDPRLPDRFWSKVQVEPNDCWLWTASLDKCGYGKFGLSGRMAKAHRVAYLELVQLIDSALELDHICHSTDRSCSGGTTCLHRRCVNPAHLEPVSHYENGRRSVPAQITQCVNGHPYTPDNTYLRPSGKHGQRDCRACIRDRVRRYTQRRKAA